ncbi:hypothetical protein TNCV_4136181 [Trichonephila clavipes]|nr:hypothetical protein TNCV_4136181 [Trichonephila clavipes]
MSILRLVAAFASQSARSFPRTPVRPRTNAKSIEMILSLRLLSCFWISTIILLDEEILLRESKEERQSVQMRYSEMTLFCSVILLTAKFKHKSSALKNCAFITNSLSKLKVLGFNKNTEHNKFETNSSINFTAISTANNMEIFCALVTKLNNIEGIPL